MPARETFPSMLSLRHPCQRWGPGCNGATRAAARLSALGFSVKEMIGGIEYWRREGLPVEGSLGDEAPLVG